MSTEPRFLNVFPNELEHGDVWAEGCEVEITLANPEEMTHAIHFKPLGRRGWVCADLGCELHWPDNAPHRVMRPT